MSGPTAAAIEKGRQLDALAVAIERTRRDWHAARQARDDALRRFEESVDAMLRAADAHREAVAAYEAAR